MINAEQIPLFRSVNIFSITANDIISAPNIIIFSSLFIFHSFALLYKSIRHFDYKDIFLSILEWNPNGIRPIIKHFIHWIIFSHVEFLLISWDFFCSNLSFPIYIIVGFDMLIEKLKPMKSWGKSRYSGIFRWYFHLVCYKNPYLIYL